MRTLTVVSVIITLCLLILPAQADELHLSSGRVLDGTLIEQTGGFVVFRTASGAQARFPTKQVVKIVKGTSSTTLAKTRLAALAPNDLRDRLEATIWEHVDRDAWEQH